MIAYWEGGGGGGGKSPKALSYRNIGIGRVECMFL